MNAAARVTRRKLTVFGVVAVVAVLVLAVNYLDLPRTFGWGQMKVSAHLPQASGLGPNSRVTYRGQEVGRVTAVRLGPAGVVAQLTLEKSADLPADVRAQVHSMSVIGEQYLELAPTNQTAATTTGQGRLTEGTSIAAAASRPVPVDASALLANVNRLLTTVDPKELNTTVNELGTAFNGTGDDLGDLLDSGHDLIGTAQENLGATRQLIDNLGPVLTTQVRTAPQLKDLARNLARFTGQLSMSDNDLRQLIAQGPAAAEQITALTQDLHPTLPITLANLAATGEVLRVFLPGIKQFLVIYPAVAANQQVARLQMQIPKRPDFVFHINVNDPPGCTTGYTTPWRSPNDLSKRSGLPPDQWCRVPSDSPLAVRGVRNSPCPNNNLRSATAAGCGLNFTTKPKVTVTSYDPKTGLFKGPDGKTYRVDLSAGRSAARSPYSTGLLEALGAR